MCFANMPTEEKISSGENPELIFKVGFIIYASFPLLLFSHRAEALVTSPASD